MLELKTVSVYFQKKLIVDTVSCVIKPREITLLMGPNGSGKSTLSGSIMGNPQYSLSDKSKIILDGEDISHTSVDERARKGIFYAFQNPTSIPGVSVAKLLRELIGSDKVAARKLLPDLKKYAKDYQFKEELLTRGIHDGFSGGEKKKIEMIQAQYLAKKYALFDEIDTGLDIDALKKVAQEINNLKKKGIGCLVITHFARLTDYLQIDRVMVMRKGKLVKTADVSIIREIEEKGYGHF